MSSLWLLTFDVLRSLCVEDAISDGLLGNFVLHLLAVDNVLLLFGGTDLARLLRRLARALVGIPQC